MNDIRASKERDVPDERLEHMIRTMERDTYSDTTDFDLDVLVCLQELCGRRLAYSAGEPPAEQFGRSIYEASIVGLRNLLALALAHVDFGALKVSHQKDHDTLAPFASIPAHQPFVRPFTPNEAKAYRAFIEDYFEPASPQPPEAGCVSIPLDIAKVIDGAFLPNNPNRLRNAHRDTVIAAHRFKDAVRTALTKGENHG